MERARDKGPTHDTHRKARSAEPATRPPWAEQLLDLQRRAGNRAVTSMLSTRHPTASEAALLNVLGHPAAHRLAEPSGLTVQRDHEADGNHAPKELCEGYAKLVQLSKSPYRFSWLHLFILPEAVMAYSWRKLCRQWLDDFRKAGFDHERFARADFNLVRVPWVGEPGSLECWTALRSKAEAWAVQAENEYVQYSEIHKNAMPSPEEMEDASRQATSGLGGATFA